MIELVNSSIKGGGKIVIFNMVRDDEAKEVYKSMEFANSLQAITKSPQLAGIKNAKYENMTCNDLPSRQEEPKESNLVQAAQMYGERPTAENRRTLAKALKKAEEESELEIERMKKAEKKAHHQNRMRRRMSLVDA